MLLYFYAPGLPGTETMEKYFSTEASDFLKKHVAARVDVNQLQGGSIAKQYAIFKVPTLLVISPDAKSHKRASMSRDSTWKSLEAQLNL